MEAFHAANTLVFMCGVLGFAVAAQRMPLDDLVLVVKGSRIVLDKPSQCGSSVGTLHFSLTLFLSPKGLLTGFT